MPLTLPCLAPCQSICNTIIAANNAQYVPPGYRLNDGMLGILGFIAGATSCWRVWKTVGGTAAGKSKAM